ncbi:MAG: hypothetical protein ACOYXR_00115 [Nitrospirota bacterium]
MAMRLGQWSVDTLFGRRTIGGVIASVLVFFMVVSALCPLPSLAMTEAPVLGDAASSPMECPFHPGQTVSLSITLQYALDTLTVLPIAPVTFVPPDVISGALWSEIPHRVEYAEPHGPVPPHVPLFVLHASLIR